MWCRLSYYSWRCSLYSSMLQAVAARMTVMHASSLLCSRASVTPHDSRTQLQIHLLVAACNQRCQSHISTR